MCGLCGVLLSEHWAEEGSGRRGRALRVALLNRVLEHFGLRLDDWSGSVYVLRDLLSRRDRGEIPDFRRVVVETTGLADPAPIVFTLLSEPVVRHHYELDGLVATVDAVHGLRHEDSVKQAAIADTLVVTKADAADPEPVESELARLNPAAEIVEASFGDAEP